MVRYPSGEFQHPGGFCVPQGGCFHRGIWYPQKREWLKLSEGGELGWGKLGSSELGCKGLG